MSTEESSSQEHETFPLNIQIEAPRNDFVPTVSYVHSKIIEFNSLFNSCYRMSLLNCTPQERHNVLTTLEYLKKSVEFASNEVGKSLRNQTYQFNCGLCNEEIVIGPNEDAWSSLQSHEHFEELFYRFLNNKLDTVPVSEKTNHPTFMKRENNVLTEDNNTAGDSNTDSGIEQPEMEPSTSGVNSKSRKVATPSDENVNNFRFNFIVGYDEYIEGKIFPPSIMQGIRKYDKVKECTMMRSGNTKALCLICNCEMNGMRISKQMLVSHALGQKHLKAASDGPTLQMLQSYHEFWLKQERQIQAHQVYFRPHDKLHTQCVLCSVYLRSTEIVPHILNERHGRKVLDMYNKRNNLYMLVNLQVQAYGITQEQIDARDQKEAARKEVRRAKNSDSDTADEGRKVAKRPPPIVHNIIKAVEKPESRNPFDHLPNRMKSEAEFLKIITKPKGTFIRCDLCKFDLPVDVEILKTHITTANPHMSRKKGNYVYYCEICNTKTNSENSWMKHNFSGPRHLNMAASRRENVMEYECTTCKTVIFGDELSLTRHLGVGNKTNGRDRGFRLPECIKKLFQSREHIFAHAIVLAEAAEEVLANSLTQDCCRRLESALTEVFEECKVYPFGSRISGLGNKDSDLDVFVDIGGTYYGDMIQDPADQVIVIRKGTKVFQKSKEYSNIVQVLTARTPILKLHHVPTKLDCDLSFKHGLSVENTKFLRFCLELQPTCQQLTLLVKKWAESIGLECVTTYALAILCIFYMQVNGYLLSVQKLRELNKVATPSISGWKTINYVLSVAETRAHVKSYDKTVYDLLQEFFKFYSTFDFNSHVVCPLLGRVVKRSLFEGSPLDLPPEMEAYVVQLEGECPELFRSNSYMCIQDPFDLSHNLTKAAQQGTLARFQALCKLSLSHIEASK